MTRRFVRDINERPESPIDEFGGPGEAVPVNPFPGFLGGVHGSILYRSAVGWVWLAPGTAGQLLTTQGEGANPTWETDLARSTFTWWSEPQEVVTLTTSSGTKSLPSVVVGDFPTGATAVRVIAIFKFREVGDTSGTLNDLNAACGVDIQVRETGGCFIAAINLKDQQFQVKAGTEGPGDVLFGDVDLTCEFNGNTTYNFQFAAVVATGNNLILRDVQCGLQVMWS